MKTRTGGAVPIMGNGNLILNWPKLLRPFEGLLKQFFHVILMCMCSQCDSTSLPVQRNQI